MRTLLVDDDVVFAKLVVTKLAELGLRDVTVAHSAEEALSLLDQGSSPFDCFLLDIVLGHSDGIDLCHILRMRADSKLAPIIMVTSQRDSTLMSRAFSAGATDFLRKPLDHNELVGRIKTAMLLVEFINRTKAPKGGSEMPPRRNYLLHDSTPTKPVWFPKIKGMVEFACLQKRLSELRSRDETPNLYRVQIKDFGTLLSQSDYTELKRHLHQVSSLLSEAASGDQILFSYLGRGRFIICLSNHSSGHAGETAEKMQNRVNLGLSQALSTGSKALKLRISNISRPRPASSNTTTHDVRGEHSINPDALALDLPLVDDIEERIFEKALAKKGR
ncbi:sigma-B regulation protein RsbU (phosphoserine phosphatase) [Roseovarius sp. MBR-51]